MDFIIKDGYDGKRVIDYLKNELHMSRAEITSLKLKEKGIILNEERVTVRAIMSKNDILSLDRADDLNSQNENIIPKYFPIDILYEDENMIAVNKPYGMPTHPSHGHFTDTLANALAYYFSEKNQPFVFRAVNRLDRDTSGVVLVAKNRFSAYNLSTQISKGLVNKTYTAIVSGVLSEGGTVIKNIKRFKESIIQRVVCDSNEGQYCETHYTPLASDGKITILSVTPRTGRTHQIRVHLSYIGHPIIGDTLYGDSETLNIIPRQALHCSSLTIKKPDSEEMITITAPLHNDMKKIADCLTKTVF